MYSSFQQKEPATPRCSAASGVAGCDSANTVGDDPRRADVPILTGAFSSQLPAALIFASVASALSTCRCGSQCAFARNTIRHRHVCTDRLIAQSDHRVRAHADGPVRGRPVEQFAEEALRLRAIRDTYSNQQKRSLGNVIWSARFVPDLRLHGLAQSSRHVRAVFVVESVL